MTPSHPRPRLCCWSGLAGAVLLWVGAARAQVPVERLDGFLSGARPGFITGGWVVSAEDRHGVPALALAHLVRRPIGRRHSVIRASDAGLAALLHSTGVPGAGVAGRSGLRWSPPRHLLMDRARATLRLETARASGAGSGQGVVIGIVDSGVDALHPDLRHADGTTRLAWWLDFASNPAGSQPELEAELGCQPEAGLRCQIASGADVDERLANDVTGDEPRDAIGHGTIVASIAAGNGSFAGGSVFAGVAPEATLIAARVTGAAGGIADSDVVLATEFVFDRARELGMPAVVNLSLGSDFGAHDGSSELSEALAELAGPGRAIVVAAGNSGQLRYGLAAGAPEPFGVHTELTATAELPARATLLTPFPAYGGDTTDASLFVWVDLYPPEALSLSVVLPDGTRVGPVGMDQSRVTPAGALVAAVVHGVGDVSGRESVLRELPDSPLSSVLPSRGSAVVLIDGRWPAGQSFMIDVEGEGRAELWVQSEGDLAPEASAVGALFAAATARSTVTIPAAHPGLIAVGASIDRIDWTDHRGAPVSVAELPVSPAVELGAAAFFSSAGPSSSGAFKPDLVAPGAFVIGALSAAADPRAGASGIFSGGLCAGLDCQIVSDGYALTAGTSMAAPMVSGAVALLLERQPELTPSELRGLLIAGAAALPIPPDVSSREGAGALDVAGSIRAALAPPRAPAERPAAEHSRLRVAADHAVADASRSLAAMLWLEDASGEAFELDGERLRVTVTGGELRAQPVRIAPGLFELSIAAPPPAPLSMSIEVAVDDEPLLSIELPIEGGRAPSMSRDDGGCAVSGRRSSRPWGNLPWLALVLLGCLSRWRPRAQISVRYSVKPCGSKGS